MMLTSRRRLGMARATNCSRSRAISGRRTTPDSWRLTAFLCWILCSAAWSQDAPIPPKIVDVIRDKAVGKDKPVRINSVRTAQIDVGSGAEREMLSRDQYEIVAWDGVTNASEIMAGCESSLHRVRQALEAIELQGDQDEAVARLQNEQNTVAEGLKRVRAEAGPVYQRAQSHLRDLKNISADDAVQRHAVLQRVWPTGVLADLTNPRRAAAPADFAKLGLLLFRVVLPPAVQEALSRHGGPLSFATEELQLPWELLHDGRKFLCLSQPATLRRFGSLARSLRGSLSANWWLLDRHQCRDARHAAWRSTSRERGGLGGS
jgi:hypothetical protein